MHSRHVHGNHQSLVALGQTLAPTGVWGIGAVSKLLPLYERFFVHGSRGVEAVPERTTSPTQE